MLDLRQGAGRTAFVRARPRSASGGRLAFTLANWAPQRPWIVGLVAAAIMTPALLSLTNLDSIRELWMVQEGGRMRFVQGDITVHGWEFLALGAAGALVLLYTVVSTLARRRLAGAATLARPVRVQAPSEVAAEAAVTEFMGTARLASVEILAPLSGTPCLAFGLRAHTEAAEICDAEGGDFDLVLDSGDRVAISLEHATLEGAAETEHSIDLAVVARSDGEAAEQLSALLDARCVPLVAGERPISELILREGARVSVTGIVQGGPMTRLAYRPSARVLSGSEGAPLRVRVL